MRAQAMSSTTCEERESTTVLTWTRMTQGRECEKEKEDSGFRTPRPSSGVWQKRHRFDVYENETVIIKEGLRRKRFTRRHFRICLWNLDGILRDGTYGGSSHQELPFIFLSSSSDGFCIPFSMRARSVTRIHQWMLCARFFVKHVLRKEYFKEDI